MSSGAKERVHFILSNGDEAVHVTAVIPMHSANAVGNILADKLIFPLTQFKEDLPSNVASCMVAQPLPPTDVWKTAYDEVEERSFMIKLLQPKSEFSEKNLRILHTSYRHPLRENRMKLLNGRIVIMTPIGSISRFLTLIVVPTKLRRTIFHAYQTTPMGAHMKRYKTLLIIRGRFF